MKKPTLLLIVMMFLLTSCARQFSADGYIGREAYLTAGRDDLDYYREHKPSIWTNGDWTNGDLIIYDAAVGYGLDFAGEPPRDGRLYLTDGSSAALFLDENVTYFGYLREWVICVINNREFIVLDGNGKSRQTLFAAYGDVIDFHCDGDVVHYLDGETLWRYYGGEKSPEQVITFSGMIDFTLISNTEYVFFAPSPAYLNALAQMTEQELEANERHFILAEKGVQNSCVYYIDIRNISEIYEFDPFDDSYAENGPPYWYEQYRAE